MSERQYALWDEVGGSMYCSLGADMMSDLGDLSVRHLC